MPKVTKRTKLRQSRSSEGKIVIDERNGMVFETEEQLLKYFEKDVSIFENEYLSLRGSDDFSDKESEKLLPFLDLALDDPDEIWEDDATLKGRMVYIYIRKVDTPEGSFHYIAVAHLVEDNPTFIYLHFPTRAAEVVDNYRRGEQVYDRRTKEVEKGVIEGDALGEGDELAAGLYKAMLKLRGDQDIPEEEFQNFSEYREETIHEPDEIWRTSDFAEEILVNFIREFPDADEGKDVYYIVVTVEDSTTGSHALLFSFPTRDPGLVERYRHGENLQADEVIQEASH